VEEQQKRRGPGQGRPFIGPEMKTRVPKLAAAKIDAEAERRGVKRADVLREMIVNATEGLPEPQVLDLTG
jgi:hypothetical protein